MSVSVVPTNRFPDESILTLSVEESDINLSELACMNGDVLTPAYMLSVPVLVILSFVSFAVCMCRASAGELVPIPTLSPFKVIVSTVSFVNVIFVVLWSTVILLTSTSEPSPNRTPEVPVSAVKNCK